MATHLHVVLREDVDNLGASGDLVRVRPGYARNYLIPRGLAVPASDGNVRRVEHERRVSLARAEKANKKARTEAETLNGLTARIKKKVGESGKLFGSVTSQDVVAALEAQHGMKVDRKKIQLPKDGIKAVGTFDAALRLTSSIEANFQVEVVAEEG